MEMREKKLKQQLDREDEVIKQKIRMINMYKQNTISTSNDVAYKARDYYPLKTHSQLLNTNNLNNAKSSSKEKIVSCFKDRKNKSIAEYNTTPHCHKQSQFRTVDFSNVIMQQSSNKKIDGKIRGKKERLQIPGNDDFARNEKLCGADF